MSNRSTCYTAMVNCPSVNGRPANFSPLPREGNRWTSVVGLMLVLVLDRVPMWQCLHQRLCGGDAGKAEQDAPGSGATYTRQDKGQEAAQRREMDDVPGGPASSTLLYIFWRGRRY